MNNNNTKETFINDDSSSILEKAENSAIEVAKYLLSLDPTRKYLFTTFIHIFPYNKS
jgi:hypothetical protein